MSDCPRETTAEARTVVRAVAATTIVVALGLGWFTGAASGQTVDPADTNCDGVVDAFDIEPFFALMCDGGTPCATGGGDVNGDGSINAFDLIPFRDALFATSSTGIPQSARIYFDTAAGAVPSGEPEDARAHAGTTAKGNPVLTGGGRLYIYWEYLQSDQIVFLPNFKIEVDGGTITAAHFYDRLPLFGGPRWAIVSPSPFTPVVGNTVEFRAVTLGKFTSNGPLAAFDPQFSAADSSSLLGFVDVTSTGTASVWLTVDDCGMSIGFGEGATDNIFFGFGDPSLTMNQSDVRTTMADATIVPADCDDDGVPDDVDQCVCSDVAMNVVIDGCDTGVPNQVLENGCTLADLISQCADNAVDHGAFVACVAQLTNDWRDMGLISGSEMGSIQGCAGGANIP